MTVSERASRIYKLIKPSGGTWKQAMKQANEEIYKENARLEEEDARREMEALEDRTMQEPGPISVNMLLNDVLIALEEKYINETDQGYPYSRARNALIRKYGIGEFADLIYSYTKKDSWDSEWREEDGTISNEWLNEVDRAITALGLNTSEFESYGAVAGQFR